MQPFTTPLPGRTLAKKFGPNIVDREDYKMHILLREWKPGLFEILIERWMPETGWTSTQILADTEELERIRQVLGC